MRGASISRCYLSPSQAVLLSGYGSAASRMPSHRDDAPPFQRPPSRGRAYHPTNLLRVNMAAMGIVDDSVDENSGLSAEAVGSWYGTTAKTGRVSRPRCTGPRGAGAGADGGWGRLTEVRPSHLLAGRHCCVALPGNDGVVWRGLNGVEESGVA